MNDEELLELLRLDLENPPVAYNPLLKNLLAVSRKNIEREGITLTDSVDDGHLVISYAAWLFRKRKAEDTAMPRMLRWALNNRLMSQKGATGDAS